MAQVNIQKLQGGGTVKSYGTFTKDGVTYQVDDNFLQAMTAHGGSIGDGRARADYGAIVNALKSGADLSYDSNTNELRGNVSFNNLNSRQQRRAAKRTSRTGEALDSTFNGRVNQTKTAVNALRGFSYNSPEPLENKNKEVDVSNGIRLNYERDKDGNLILNNGKRTYIEGTDNSRIFNRLDFIRTLPNEENIIGWRGYRGADKNAYIRASKDYQDWDNLYTRIKEGSITDKDTSFLKQLGILDTEGATGTSENDGSEDPKIKGYDTQRGITEDQRNKLGLTYGNNGELLAGEKFNFDGYGSKWQNAFFGENFVRNNPQYSWLQDYILYNGQFYDKGEWSNPESEINKILASSNIDIFNKMRNNLFDPSQNGGWNTLWTNSPYKRYDPETQYNPYFLKTYGNNNNVLYSYTSPLYQNLPQGVTTMDVIDENTPRNDFGLPSKISTIGLDANGNPVDLSQYIRSDGFNGEATGNAFYSRIPRSDKTLGGYVWDDFDPNNKYKFAYNPENGEEGYFYDIEESKLYPISRNQFRNWALEDNYLDAGEITDIKNIDSSKVYRFLFGGFKGKRKPSISYHQEIPKQQTGGLINWISKDSPKEDTKLQTRDEKKAATTSQITKGDLTSADKWQIGALAGDLSALVASIPTGGNPVAAGLGVGSTLAQLTSDVKRDGLDWGDIGNAALGLGLDAVTFIPGVGIAGKAAKTAKIIKRMKPLLTASFSAMGLTAALGSLNKEEEWSLDDYRNILMGVQGIMGGKRALERNLAYKKTGKVAVDTGKATPEKLTDVQKRTINDLVAADSKRFEKKDWFNKDTGAIDYDKALVDAEITTELPKNKLYQEGLSKIRSSYKNITNSFSDKLTGDNTELRARATEELPWFLQNRLGRSWLQGAQSREFGNVAHRLENREAYQQDFNLKSDMAPNIFERGWRASGELINGSPAYYNPYWFPKARTHSFVGGKGRIKPAPYNYPYQPNFKNPTLYTPRNIDPYLQSVGGYYSMPFHKKGGKIVKAQSGIKIAPVSVSAWNPNILTPQQAAIEARNQFQIDQLTGIDSTKLFKPVPNRVFAGGKEFLAPSNIPLHIQHNRNLRKEAYEDLKNPYRNAVNPKQVETPLPKENTSTVTGNTGKSGLSGLLNPKNLLDVGSLVGSIVSNNRQRRDLAKGIKAAAQGQLRSMPTEVYNSFTDNGLVRTYDQRLKDIRNYRTVGSDPNQVMAERLMRDQQADQLAGERDTKMSQMIDQFDQNDIAARRGYAEQRTQTADYNRAVLGQMENMLSQNEATRKAVNWQGIINPFLGQKRLDLTRDQNEQQQATSALEMMQSQQSAQKSLDDLLNSTRAQQAWQNEQNVNTDWRTKYGEGDAGYQKFVSDRFAGDIQTLQNSLMLQGLLSQYNNGVDRFSGRRRALVGSPVTMTNYKPLNYGAQQIGYNKKGGTVTPKRYRDFNEQILLDSRKDFRKAVQKMDDNLVRLLIKMLS